jgi:hypothetical protein
MLCYNGLRGLLGSQVRVPFRLVSALLTLPLLLRVLCMCHVQGFEIGSGFSGARMTGSEHNDPFYMDNGAVRTRSNRCADVWAPSTHVSAVQRMYRQQVQPCKQLLVQMRGQMLVLGSQQGMQDTHWFDAWHVRVRSRCSSGAHAKTHAYRRRRCFNTSSCTCLRSWQQGLLLVPQHSHVGWRVLVCKRQAQWQ